MAPPPEEISAGSILRELIVNQYQAIVAAGVRRRGSSPPCAARR